MANLSGFDANNVSPEFGFDPVPNGDYKAAIIQSEMKTTQKGDGSYLALTFEVLEGECKGRKVFTNLNLSNPNPTAVKIAQAELSAICHATGKMKPNDSIELHNIPMIISVACTKRKDTQELSNSIKKYTSMKEAMAGVGAGNGDSGEKAPWEK